LDTAKTSHSLEHKLYKVGSLIFAYGREQRALVLNPFDEIDRPQVAYTVPEILAPAQFKRLLETAEEEVPELIPFLAMAGFAGNLVVNGYQVFLPIDIFPLQDLVLGVFPDQFTRAIDVLFRWKPRCFIGFAHIEKRRGFSFPWSIARSGDE